MLLTSSWVLGGFLLDAAILNGLKKHETSRLSCSTYSSSASTMRNTKLRNTSLLTLLSILPLGRFLALHDLQQVKVFLLQLLLLQQELVKGGHPNHVYPGLALALRLRPQVILPLVLPAIRDGEAELRKDNRSDWWLTETRWRHSNTRDGSHSKQNTV
ncbi:hypothetical protein E2C01_049884 [Portunus trituberculatus]|uniref:Uncharacterized protein n=1 Tax=Portunus trituberculatus TaxID=210409 RepID=A0A5B7GEZ8_PORTR|nr:hypothetical protein [Portunus trituberculatus]